MVDKIFPLVISQIIDEYLKPFPFLKQISYVHIKVKDTTLYKARTLYKRTLIFDSNIIIISLGKKSNKRQISVHKDSGNDIDYLEYGFCKECSVNEEIWHLVSNDTQKCMMFLNK